MPLPIPSLPHSERPRSPPPSPARTHLTCDPLAPIILCRGHLRADRKLRQEGVADGGDYCQARKVRSLIQDREDVVRERRFYRRNRWMRGAEIWQAAREVMESRDPVP